MYVVHINTFSKSLMFLLCSQAAICQTMNVMWNSYTTHSLGRIFLRYSAHNSVYYIAYNVRLSVNSVLLTN